jgi:hypothetical protein
VTRAVRAWGWKRTLRDTELSWRSSDEVIIITIIIIFFINLFVWLYLSLYFINIVMSKT